MNVLRKSHIFIISKQSSTKRTNSDPNISKAQTKNEEQRHMNVNEDPQKRRLDATHGLSNVCHVLQPSVICNFMVVFVLHLIHVDPKKNTTQQLKMASASDQYDTNAAILALYDDNDDANDEKTKQQIHDDKLSETK